MNRPRYIFVGILFLLLVGRPANAQEKYYTDYQGNLRIENDYIAIFVNQGGTNLGRFALDVTGGNPLIPGDSNKPLIYGHPQPWSSFTTIRIDGEDYIFGGATNKRAGREGKYGKILIPPQIVGGEKIVTKVSCGDIEVLQDLSFMTSTTTGFPDTAKIKYTVTNVGNASSTVGLRIMLDTMLGANDGAPFRVFDEVVTTDTVLIRSEIPDFWQAFDSLSNPMVMAQGGLKEDGLTPPDKIYFTNWGSLADGIWDFNFRPGQEFVREGEFELDSAIALFWAPEVLKPGESKTFVTSYGLGGITIVPGLLALGVTSPATVVFDEIRSSFPIVAYIENTSKVVAKDVQVALNLPGQFTVGNQTAAKKFIGDLQPAESVQMAWQVYPRQADACPESITYEVLIEAGNTDSNLAKRKVMFTSPPQLSIDLTGPQSLDLKGYLLQPNPFDVVGTIKNIGGAPSYNSSARLVLPPGLSTAFNDLSSVSLGTVEPGEEITIQWKIQALGIDGDIPYGMEVYSLNAPTGNSLQTVFIPIVDEKIYMRTVKETIKEGDIFSVDIILANVQDFADFSLDINYLPKYADPLFVSRGGIFIQESELLPFSFPLIDKNRHKITNIGGTVPNGQVSSGVLARIHFYAREKGNFRLQIDNLQIRDIKGKELKILTEDLLIKIE